MKIEDCEVGMRVYHASDKKVTGTITEMRSNSVLVLFDDEDLGELSQPPGELRQLVTSATDKPSFIYCGVEYVEVPNVYSCKDCAFQPASGNCYQSGYLKLAKMAFGGICRSRGVIYIKADKSTNQAKTNSTPKTHSHYFKDVSHLSQIDVYRVLELFDVTDQKIGHAVKKLLCAGQRGAKDVAKDVQEAIDGLERWKAMQEEDKQKQ